jgi:hypothetical protein
MNDLKTRIRVAFPAMPEGYAELLMERFRAHGFTEQEIECAVNRVIDKFQYPTPTIGEFLSLNWYSHEK